MFHANGWTFTWTITAAGARHICLRAVDRAVAFPLMSVERVTHLCAAPTVLIALANAPEELKKQAPRGVQVMTAGAPPAAVTIERLEAELGWTVTHVYGLTETAPFITICEPRPEHANLAAEERARIKARQGVELITSGETRVVSPRRPRSATRRRDRRRDCRAGQRRDGRVFQRPGCHGCCHTVRLVHMGDAAVVHPDGYIEVRDRIKDVIISGGENISSVEVEALLLRHDAVQRSRRRRHAAREVGRSAACVHRFSPGTVGVIRGAPRVLPRAHRALQGAPQLHPDGGTAEDGHRQDSEVRLAQGAPEHLRTIAGPNTAKPSVARFQLPGKPEDKGGRFVRIRPLRIVDLPRPAAACC